MEFSHYSVMLPEVMEALNIRENGIYIDGTMGGAGHSLAICARLATGRLIGFDQDEDAILAAKKRLADHHQEMKATIISDNYEHMRERLEEIGIEKADGILLDLGVSSYQLDEKERGFSYMQPDAALDMRMDRRKKQTAADILNSYSEEELVRVLRDYGEERCAHRIAKNIVDVRKTMPFSTVGQLNEVVDRSIPAKMKKTGGHPSKRTFQALRIELNRELEVLENTLDEMVDLLNPGGRLVIITFHSLEDRIVKNKFKTYENPCTCPKDFPVCVCGKKPKGVVITRKPILPSQEELEINSRSKSAKLRVFERNDQ
ncbi:MAG: 16S rRNA (cytosine(1402)-N(4))-methyltransferase RsmH [Lachnospiraceae bacterium]|nr:16S rRNA (cytosine(1402)-N(4))-methyltransferase RsmH [Lachnospiraceae bacterium]